MTIDDATASRVTEQVLASRRYRQLDASLVRRFVVDELRRHRSEAEAVKQVKRRLHQAVGAYRSGTGSGASDDPLAAVRVAWAGDLRGAAFKDACREVLGRHASTRERLPHLDAFYAGIWQAIGGPPASLMDLGCGLDPLALPWMDLQATATIHAIDADVAQLATVDAFLSLVAAPHLVEAMDLAAAAPTTHAQVALLLKLVPLLDRQDRAAAPRLLGGLEADHAVISFPRRSLGGRRKGMEATYRRRLDSLVAELGERVANVREASVPNELVFVLTLRQPHG